MIISPVPMKKVFLSTSELSRIGNSEILIITEVSIILDPKLPWNVTKSLPSQQLHFKVNNRNNITKCKYVQS